METINGWIKVHRKMLNNPVVWKDADHVAVWMYLLLNATHREHRTMFGGKVIVLAPGQLISGRKKIAEFTGINEYKVKRILKQFENAQQIAQQTERYGTLISILAWSDYQEDAQQDAQQVHNECTTSAQRVHNECTLNKNVKNIKNDKKYKKGAFVPPSVDEVKAYCTERKNRVDPDAFIDFYQSKNWMVGKNKMSDWKAAVRNWERGEAGKDRRSVSKLTNEPPKYKVFEPEPDVDAVQMPDEIRERLGRIF